MLPIPIVPLHPDPVLPQAFSTLFLPQKMCTPDFNEHEFHQNQPSDLYDLAGFQNPPSPQEGACTQQSCMRLSVVHLVPGGVFLVFAKEQVLKGTSKLIRDNLRLQFLTHSLNPWMCVAGLRGVILYT